MARLIDAEDVKKRADCYPPQIRNVVANILRHTKTVKPEPCEDTISRQMAIAEIARWIGYIDEDMILRIQTGLKKLPSAQPEQDEWCTDCKEYDSEKHCCPRFNRVIRNALKDAERKEQDDG